MNITKSIQEKTTVILKIELSTEELKPYVERATKRVSAQVKVPGFRPGHVPYDVLKQHVSEMEIYQEAVDDIIRETLPKAVQQEEVNFVGQPQVAVEALAPNNPLIYSATFALMPEVQLNDYTTITVDKPEVKIDEAKVKVTLENLRKMRSLTKSTDAAAVKGNQVMVDFDITLAGVSVEGGQGKDVPIVIGEANFIPGFEEQLVGLKGGETKEFTITFPKEYAAKHLAGKECQVKATVKSVNVVTLPELDDAFAKELNFKSFQELNDQIRDNIKRELANKADQDFEVAVIEAVVQQATFDPIPALMLEYELDRMFEEMKEQVEDQGGKMDDYLQHIKKSKEELRDTWKEHAAKRVKSALVIKAAAEKEKITVSEDQMNQEIERRKAAYKDNADALKQVESLEYRGYVRTVLRNQQALELLKQHAAQKEKKG